jgi:TolA-binding protein
MRKIIIALALLACASTAKAETWYDDHGNEHTQITDNDVHRWRVDREAAEREEQGSLDEQNRQLAELNRKVDQIQLDQTHRDTEDSIKEQRRRLGLDD